MSRTRAECFYLEKVKKKKPIIIIQTNETLNKATFFHVSIEAPKRRPCLYIITPLCFYLSQRMLYMSS